MDLGVGGHSSTHNTCKWCSLEFGQPGDSGPSTLLDCFDFSELCKPAGSEITMGVQQCGFWWGGAAGPLMEGRGLVGSPVCYLSLQVILKLLSFQLELEGFAWWKINLPTVFWVKQKMV